MTVSGCKGMCRECVGCHCVHGVESYNYIREGLEQKQLVLHRRTQRQQVDAGSRITFQKPTCLCMAPAQV